MPFYYIILRHIRKIPGNGTFIDVFLTKFALLPFHYTLLPFHDLEV